MSITPLPKELLSLRASIDNIDAALIHMLAERFRCTQAVGELKAREGIESADPARETRQLERLHAIARSSSLDLDFTERLFRLIVTEVVKNHEVIKSRERSH